MTEPAPNEAEAKARFLLIAVNRLFGAAMVVVGIMGVRGYVGTADWFSYALIAVGAVEFFVMPRILARAWRTPPSDDSR